MTSVEARLNSQEAPAAAETVGLDLSIPVQLSSADRLRTAFTNYVRGYSGALDYVWLERDRMAVAREVPLPSEVEVAGFLPSQRFPSDHLAVRVRPWIACARVVYSAGGMPESVLIYNRCLA